MESYQELYESKRLKEDIVDVEDFLKAWQMLNKALTLMYSASNDKQIDNLISNIDKEVFKLENVLDKKIDNWDGLKGK